MNEHVAVTVLVAVIGLALAAVVIKASMWFEKRSQDRTDAQFREAAASARRAMEVPGAEERVRFENQRDYQETPAQRTIASSGIMVTARVVAAEQTNRFGGLNDPLVDLTVEIPGPGGSYQVQMRIAVQVLDIPLCQRGSEIRARVDPNDRDNVVVLFDHHRLVPAGP